MDSPQILKRKNLKVPRSGNWTVEEIHLLIEEAEQHKDILRSKLTNSLHLNDKNEKWLGITEKLNALGIQKRNVDQIKTKWNNLNREAKKTFTETIKERKKTGGGPCPTPISPTTEKLIELNKDSTSFVGITGGFTTSGFEENKGIIELFMYIYISRLYIMSI
ncbi:hypothetical protein FSP39_012379 [Pinctada imbricata]|uniref:Myb-like domain-containing protein n=1 Tax=Pinctada imbricata TaxID=66713 RepID=A0AA88XZ45_PINIB|nr:hypothetical protein FSP39_012379 [Pinctada imbricata]